MFLQYQVTSRVARSLVYNSICCLSFCTFSFGHWVVCFFGLQILISNLVSSNSSYTKNLMHTYGL